MWFLLSPSKHRRQELDPQPIDINGSLSIHLDGVCARPRRDTDERRQFGHCIFLSSRALQSQTGFNVTSAPEFEVFVCVKWISFSNYRGLHAIPGQGWEVQWRTWITLDMSKVMNFFFFFFIWQLNWRERHKTSLEQSKWKMKANETLTWWSAPSSIPVPWHAAIGPEQWQEQGAEGWCSGDRQVPQQSIGVTMETKAAAAQENEHYFGGPGRMEDRNQLSAPSLGWDV